MYTLYGRSGTGSDAPRVILEEAQVKYEFIDVLVIDQRSAYFSGLNSKNQVPVLVLESGLVVTESGAICLLLAERHSECSLLPALGSDERADVYRWMFFLATNLYEDCRRYYHADQYISAEGESALKESALASAERHWNIVNQGLDGHLWMVGDKMTVVDIYLAMLADWSMDRSKLWTECPAVATHCQTVGKRGAAKAVGIAQ